MPLIVETGANIANADAYDSVANTDTYFDNRNNTVWGAAEFTDKEYAIRLATTYLDGYYTFNGYRSNTDQVLAWPRVLSGGADGDGKDIADDEIPLDLKKAMYELALENLTERLGISQDRAGMVKSEKVGSLQVVYMDGASSSKRFPLVDMILKNLINGSFGSITCDAVLS